ncbi:hypothetical protein LTR94_027042 [Friedmanniomyces endolithicus]|nr:hypothetical protein LTR94_027042 [Friedmanniomyces endolithicus]
MIRLHVSAPLAASAPVAPTLDQSRYLTQVMRLKAGDEIAVFNGKDGEWRASIAEVLKKGVILRCEALIKTQDVVPDLELIAAELGARRIRLVTTQRTNIDRLRLDRLDAIAEEAAEQTGRMDVPVVDDPIRLETLLDGWEVGRQLMFCDETGGAPAVSAVAKAGPGPWAILIGPEGGFSPEEGEKLRSLAFTTAVSLGPRILRADTAAIAAMTLWQAAVGDWER